RWLRRHTRRLPANGRTLGRPSAGLFETQFYLELSHHAVKQAMKLKNTFDALNLSLKYEAYTNQLFTIIPNKILHKLQQKYVFLKMEQEDKDHTRVRIGTSWAATEEDVSV